MGFDGWSPLPPPRWLLVTAACIRQVGTVPSAVREQREEADLDERGGTRWKGSGRRHRRSARSVRARRGRLETSDGRRREDEEMEEGAERGGEKTDLARTRREESQHLELLQEGGGGGG